MVYFQKKKGLDLSRREHLTSEGLTPKGSKGSGTYSANVLLGFFTLMKKTGILNIWALACVMVAGCGQSQTPGPSMLPRVERAMKSPGFWIAHHSYPDQEIMNSVEIAVFNNKIAHDLKLAKDLSKTGAIASGKQVAKDISDQIADFARQNLYLNVRKKVGPDFYARMRQDIAIESISDKINVRYGQVTHCVDQRLLPTDKILSKKIGNEDFDELQNSSLDVTSPVVVLYETKDGAWVYCDAQTSSGWIKKDDVAFCSREQFMDHVTAQQFVVVISGKADIFLDKDLTRYYDYARMGTKIPIKNILDEGTVEVPLAGRSGYFHKEDVNIGFLKYTPRYVIKQAFKLLNAPYEWGGKNGEQDCSAFMQEIFSVFGIILPRNSSAQTKIGRYTATFDKKTPISLKGKVLTESAVAGITLLRFDGHIGLYLGKHDSGHFMIHDTHGYEVRWLGFSQGRILNRVVVSDLLLGEGSRKGSLLERLLDVRCVRE